MKILKEVIVRYQTEDGQTVKAYDQEEIIRCKNCEFFLPFESNTEGMCIYAMVIKKTNGFCDFAERKEE